MPLRLLAVGMPAIGCDSVCELLEGSEATSVAASGSAGKGVGSRGGLRKDCTISSSLASIIRSV